MNENNLRIETYTCDMDGERVDTCAARLSGSTRSLISGLMESDHILLNGKLPKKSGKVKPGDTINITFPPERVINLTPKDIPFGIVIDKPDYAVIDKPAGLTVHPAPGHYDDTLVNALLFAFAIEDEDNGFRPGIVHRLDKDTSGLLVIAKNGTMRAKLSKLFGDRAVDKRYLAVCHGLPKFEEMTVDAPIGRDPRNRKRMTIIESGRNAKSIFKVIKRYKDSFLAEVQILTGRTHQIRVHSKYIGHPIIGDELYGGKALHGFTRQALHSSQLEFEDPDTEELIKATAPLPDDMQALIRQLEG